MDVPVTLHPSLVAPAESIGGAGYCRNRKPQDGRIKISVNGKKIDLRMSIIPTFYGEKVEMRLLDMQESKTNLDCSRLCRAGISGLLKKAINRPQGIILVTGPTGRGKPQTLYASLILSKAKQKTFVTIEDSDRKFDEGLNQIQLNPSRK